MYTYIVDHIPKSTPNNRRPGLALSADTITIHNTANPTSTARNERNWLSSPSNTATASYHIVIDQKEAIECIPLNEVAWHAGDGSSMDSGNRTSIAIEICESGHYDAAQDNATDLTASMLKERGWGTDRLRRHYDWSGKNCPRRMNEDGDWSGWDAFVAQVEAKLEEGNEPMLDPKDANNIILFLSAAYMATTDPEARKEFNRLANELRRVSGQDPKPG
ncbi:N-acetylmuramoyl-L-alanine amidase [Paenibacillus sp. LHD-117]|uniref:peptidoglycan recognition protein family protein n=1 Tax=Paenibacillus sp. LHD-117 TaxID=3071412 RepID=UPI0027E04656|nr:N-acetylmuramoyl-L-alanine amidase [Paenibacillus sp. LHD-117]MDQ6420798.1 N-acetylmuramoyl-L-alanine amidase [Paenibacillus sp. LHD-117]